MSAKAVPEGFHTVTPYLLVDGAAKLIEFCKKAFDAKELHRSNLPDGRIMHAVITIGDSMIMIADARADCRAEPARLYLYVPDVDAVHRKAVSAGGVSIMEPADQFYGDRTAGVKDAFGVTWWIGTHVKDVSAQELEQGMKERLAKGR